MASSTALCIAGVRNSHAINGASENQCGPKSGIRFTIATDSQNASIGLTTWHSSSFSTNERTCTEFRCARIRMLWNMRTPPPWTCKTGGYGVTTKICIFAKHRAHAGLGTVAAVYFLRVRDSAQAYLNRPPLQQNAVYYWTGKSIIWPPFVRKRMFPLDVCPLTVLITMNCVV